MARAARSRWGQDLTYHEIDDVDDNLALSLDHAGADRLPLSAAFSRRSWRRAGRLEYACISESPPRRSPIIVKASAWVIRVWRIAAALARSGIEQRVSGGVLKMHQVERQSEPWLFLYVEANETPLDYLWFNQVLGRVAPPEPSEQKDLAGVHISKLPDPLAENPARPTVNLPSARVVSTLPSRRARSSLLWRPGVSVELAACLTGSDALPRGNPKASVFFYDLVAARTP